MLVFPSIKNIKADTDPLSQKLKQKLAQTGWGQYDFAIFINSPLGYLKKNLSSNMQCTQMK